MSEKTIGITTKKSEDFSEWYTQVITKSEFVDYTSVSGCFAFRPYGYAVWERLVSVVDKRLKQLGIQNTYFPMFIPEHLLQKEAEHVEGFAPEVAWVTHAGKTKLDERLAVRPTSETIMYESVAKWVRSWRDLPMRLNQWNSVVRWEFKHPTPLIRTREFLWCEGHTAFATQEEAEQEIEDIMNLWSDVTENILAVKGLRGKKSEAEKFAGAVATYSIEYRLPNGRTAQGPDAHFDGQNFAKAFDINFLNKEGKKDYAWQNTWAITTRMLGMLAMIHGDDKGLILPPEIAPHQVVIVPILFDDSRDNVIAAAHDVAKQLRGIRTFVDERDEYNPGWKFNNWEMKGVPLRIEIGPKDIEKKSVVVVSRVEGEKKFIPLSDVGTIVPNMLKEIQVTLLKQSQNELNNNIVDVASIQDIEHAINEGKVGKGFFCGSKKAEEKVKNATEAKSLNIEQNSDIGACIAGCGRGNIAYFGKSY